MTFPPRRPVTLCQWRGNDCRCSGRRAAYVEHYRSAVYTKYIHNYQGDHVRGLNTLHGLVAAGLAAHADPRGRPGQNYFPTIAGIEYLERLERRNIAWVKSNWFPLSIAAISSLIGLLGVAVAIWTQLSTTCQ